MSAEQGSGNAQVILAVGVALFAVGQSLLFVIVAPLARAVGLTELQFGWIFSLANIGLVFSAPYWGRKSDAIGRKPIFVLGLFGSTIGTLLVALTLQGGLNGVLSGWGLFIALILARGVYGVMTSAIYPSANAYMADITDRANRARGMAVVGGANSVGAIIGPALGGGLAFMGLLFPLYVAAGVSLIGCFWAMKFLREPVRHSQERRDSDLKITDPRLRPYLILWACFFLVFIGLQFVTAFYIQDRFGITEPTQVVRVASIAFLTMAGVIAFVQIIVLQLFHIAPRTMFKLCAPLFAGALIMLAYAPSISLLVGAYALLGFSFAFANPGINGCASLAVEPHEQGRLAGYLAASNTVGVLFAPVLGTSIYQIAPNAPMLAGAVLFVLLSAYVVMVPTPTVESRVKPAGED